MKELKIAFVVDTFPTISQTFISNQIIDLQHKGHTVDIYAFRKGDFIIMHKDIKRYGLLNRAFFYEGLPKWNLRVYITFFQFVKKERKNISFKKIIKIFNIYKYGKKAISLSFFIRYYWILKRGKYDVIHAHFGHNGEYIAKLKEFGFLKNSALITSFHGYDLRPDLINIYSTKYKHLFKVSEMLTVNTPYLRSLLEQIEKTYRIKELPVGLFCEKFKSKSIRRNENKRFNILFVGRLVEFKAPDLAVEILRLLLAKGHSKLRLIIVGEGPLRKRIEDLTSKYELKEYVELKGELSQEEILYLMDECEVFLFPGIYDQFGRAETQGLVIQEAQAMNLPVIVSDAGGMKYGLIDGKTGFVVKRGDIQGFADKLELLIRNEDLRKEMGAEGRSYVTKYFDSKILGNQLEGIYLKLCENSHPK